MTSNTAPALSVSGLARRTPIALAVGLALASPAVFAAAPAPGTALGPAITVHTAATGETNATSSRSVASDANGDFVVVWAGGTTYASVFAQSYNAAGVAEGKPIAVSTNTTENNLNPSVAMDAEGDFVVAWQAGPQATSAIFAQAYKADGSPNGTVLSVSSNPAQPQIVPSVAMDAAGDFVVAWEGKTPTDSVYTIFARPYSASLTPGSLVTVTPNPTGTESVPSVAMDAAGDFVVAWQGYNAVYTTNPAVFAQLYTTAGSANGTAITVNGSKTKGSFVPSVAMDAAGDFVVAWQENVYVNKNLSVFNIFARRYTSAGAPQGTGPIPVSNNNTTTPQTSPSVSLDALGDFAVTWEVGTVPSLALAAQFYSALGVPLNPIPFAFGNPTQNPFNPSVALNADGDFVLAWGLTQYTPSDVYAQRYEGPEQIDLQSTLAASPTSVNAGSAFTLTYGLSNGSPVGTVANPTINAAVNQARAGAQASLSLPTGVGFTSATSTDSNWSCPAPSGGTLTCTYGGTLAAAGAAGALTIKLVAPSPSASETLNLTATVNGQQFDPKPANNSATVPVNVNVTAAVPIASNGSVSTQQNTAVSGTLSATGPSGAALTFAIVNQPGHGTVKITNASTGAFTYTPATGYSGSDSFTFNASDSGGPSNTATENITVSASVPPPTNGGGSGGGGGGSLGLLSMALLGLPLLWKRRRS